MTLSPRIDSIEQGIRSLAPNLIINGAMDFWQRSTSTSIASDQTYNSVDRFLIGTRGSGSGAAITRSTVVPNSQFKYSCQQVETGDSSTNNLNAIQRIEAAVIRPYIGRVMTFSVWVQFTGFSPGVAVRIQSPTSVAEDDWTTGDGAGQVVQASSGTQAITLGDWTRFTFTFTVASAHTNGMQIVLETPSYNGTPTWRHTGWMLTEGTQAPTYFYRNASNLQAEFAACQRYYWEMGSESSTFAASSGYLYGIGVVNSATTGGIDIKFPVRMRADPNIQTSGISGLEYISANTITAITGINTSLGLSRDFATIQIITAATQTAGNTCRLRKNSTSSRIAFSAEL